MPVKINIAVCPRCGNDMEFIGAQGVVDYNGNWGVESNRYDCPNGHTIFVVETERLQGWPIDSPMQSIADWATGADAEWAVREILKIARDQLERNKR